MSCFNLRLRKELVGTFNKKEMPWEVECTNTHIPLKTSHYDMCIEKLCLL